MFFEAVAQADPSRWISTLATILAAGAIYGKLQQAQTDARKRADEEAERNEERHRETTRRQDALVEGQEEMKEVIANNATETAVLKTNLEHIQRLANERHSAIVTSLDDVRGSNARVARELNEHLRNHPGPPHR